MINRWLAILSGTALTLNCFAGVIVSNGSFESGFVNWGTQGSAGASRAITTNSHSGSYAVLVTNRTTLADGVSQDVRTALLAGTNSTTYTTRCWIKLSAPASVRVRLQMLDNSGASAILLAERVVRETNQWSFIEGTEVVSWQGSLTNARVYFDIGQVVENVFPSFTLDDVWMESDGDGDKLTDSEEIVRGTNPSLPDTDGDGLPDGWEVTHGLNPTNNADGAFDSDGDGFTNFQEYWAATDPQSAGSFPAMNSVTNASPAAHQVLLRLALGPSQSSNRCFAGQWIEGGSAYAPGEYTNLVLNLATQTGHWPGILGVTYELFAETFQITTMNPIASNYWNAGGLVVVRFGPANPWTHGFYGDTNGLRDLKQLVSPGTAAYTNWMGYLDTCAAGLTELRAAGVVVMFDFLHEQNGAWFWWGRRPREDYVALYRSVHDYFTFTKGLTNVIWIFHPSESPHTSVPMDYYYPGDDVVDVAGPSIYNNTWSWAWNWDDVWRAYPKVFALPEADALKNTTPWDLQIIATNLHTTMKRCSFFSAWATFKNGPLPTLYALADNDHAQELLDDPFVATREEVDWQNFLSPTVGLQMTNNVPLVNWSGGCLDRSTDLTRWIAVTNAATPWTPMVGMAQQFFRVRRSQ